MNVEIFHLFPTLKTPRFILRPLSFEDLKPMVEIAKFKSPDAAEEQAKEWIDKSNADYQEKSGITWGVEWDNELVATIGFYRGF